jgi:hypothetical protein
MLPMEGPAKLRAAWPEVVNEAQESYGWNTPKVTRERPSPSEIDQLDRLLPLVYDLMEPNRTIVVGRMMGLTWAKIGRRVKERGLRGSGYQELRESFLRGLAALYARDPTIFVSGGV